MMASDSSTVFSLQIEADRDTDAAVDRKPVVQYDKRDVNGTF